MLAHWFETLILTSAVDLERAGKTIFQFSNRIRKTFHEKPIQEWEAALWARGLNRKLIRQDGYFFRAGAGKSGSLSLFIRNDQEQYVGLRRESITQAATFVSLVTEYGYGRHQTRFESQWMDVVVYDDQDSVLIYAENKANEATLMRLCRRLETEFLTGIPPSDEPFSFTTDRRRTPRQTVDDAVMKAHHIWRHRPPYFWAVCPTYRQSYKVNYQREGFSLVRSEFIPALF